MTCLEIIRMFSGGAETDSGSPLFVLQMIHLQIAQQLIIANGSTLPKGVSILLIDFAIGRQHLRCRIYFKIIFKLRDDFSTSYSLSINIPCDKMITKKSNSKYFFPTCMYILHIHVLMSCTTTCMYIINMYVMYLLLLNYCIKPQLHSTTLVI